MLTSSIALVNIARSGRKYMPTVVLDLSAATIQFSYLFRKSTVTRENDRLDAGLLSLPANYSKDFKLNR